MLNVTERARARLKELLTSEGVDQSVALRLGKTASGDLRVFADRERPEDQVVEHEGTAVLLIGREIAENVEGTTMDYEEGAPSPGLMVTKD